MIKRIKLFRKSENGAVTVDWVVLTAVVAGANAYLLSENRKTIREYEGKLEEVIRARAASIRRERRVVMGEKETEAIRSRAAFVNRILLEDLFPWPRLLTMLEEATPDGVVFKNVVPSERFDKLFRDSFTGNIINFFYSDIFDYRVNET